MSRRHITLNPYITQPVDNVNANNPRDLSPSAQQHLYWEIDANLIPTKEAQRSMALGSNAIAASGIYRASELQPLIGERAVTRTSNSLVGGPATSSTFARTGAGRLAAADVINRVPEQVQRQVQIRDLRSVHAPVKSSEYIEAKIRTLRNS
jgi:hypothetical protein